MGIVRDLYYARKMSAGVKVPALSTAQLIKRMALAPKHKTFGPDDVVDFTTASARQVRSLLVDLVPTQTGSGTPSPSNPRPITGLTGITVYVSPTQDPDDATTYTVGWTDDAGTVYAGTVDLATGVLTVTKKGIDMGSVDWAKSSAKSSVGGSVFSCVIGNIGDGMAPRVRYADNTMLSSMFSTAPASRWFVSQMLDNEMFSNESVIAVSASGYADGQAFKEAVTGATLVYELATPVTYQLTPEQISTLAGQNYVWASNGQDVTVHI